MPPDRGPLRVGLNLIWMTDQAGGAARYARELIAALLAADPTIELTLFISRAAPESLRAEPWADAVSFVEFPVRFPQRRHLLWLFGATPAVAMRRRLHLVHGLTGSVPVLIPRVKSVVTVLDVIWLRLPDLVVMSAAERASWLRIARLCVRFSERVVAISQSAADDVAAALPVDRAHIDVTPLGFRMGETAIPTPAAQLRARLELGDGPVVLCVAQKHPYKQQSRLIEALAALNRPDVRLVLPGHDPGGYEGELAALADRLGVGAQVRLLGWVADEDLEGLYALATCAALPSLMEGFGLPVLEAMGRGVPVVCSDRSGLAEVAGDAALTFDPTDQRAVTDAVRRILDDEALRRDLVARGRARCAQYTWARTAELTLETYRRVRAGRP